MKTAVWLVVGVLGLVASNARADGCTDGCVQTVKACQVTCKKELKDVSPNKISFCQTKCKEFENGCKKQCEDQGRRQRR